jgi:hypothetical protein
MTICEREQISVTSCMKLICLESENTGVVLQICYGYNALSENDPIAEIAGRGMESFSASFPLGAFLVNFIPARKHRNQLLATRVLIVIVFIAVKYVPDWLPGAEFKRKGKEWAESVQAMVDAPFNLVKRQMVRTCFSRNLIAVHNCHWL